MHKNYVLAIARGTQNFGHHFSSPAHGSRPSCSFVIPHSFGGSEALHECCCRVTKSEVPHGVKTWSSSSVVLGWMAFGVYMTRTTVSACSDVAGISSMIARFGVTNACNTCVDGSAECESLRHRLGRCGTTD
jgi:hypothetical protein